MNFWTGDCIQISNSQIRIILKDPADYFVILETEKRLTLQFLVSDGRTHFFSFLIDSKIVPKCFFFRFIWVLSGKPVIYIFIMRY